MGAGVGGIVKGKAGAALGGVLGGAGGIGLKKAVEWADYNYNTKATGSGLTPKELDAYIAGTGLGPKSPVYAETPPIALSDWSTYVSQMESSYQTMLKQTKDSLGGATIQGV